MAQRVTTNDIAREAGVSRTTVSHVLNNHPRIVLSPKTRKRSWQRLESLATFQTLQRCMLVTGRSRTIGLILSPPDLISVDAFVPMVIFGLNEACHTQGYRLLMETIQILLTSTPTWTWQKKRIDALIVINPRKGNSALKK